MNRWNDLNDLETNDSQVPDRTQRFKVEKHAMTIQSIFRTLLVTGALLAISGPALADGNTIAASGKSSTLGVGMTRTLASGLGVPGDFGTDVCTTIVNRSDKTGLIQLTLTDDNAASASTTIPKAKSLGLCRQDTLMVEIECLGPKKCAFTWSVDQF